MQIWWEKLNSDMDGRHDSATQGRRAVLCSDRVLAARVDGGRRWKVTWSMEECGLSFERGKCEWRQMGRLNGRDCRLAVVREAAERWKREPSNSKREEPEKSQVNGGNLNELSDRRTDRKEKKLRKTRNDIICSATAGK